MPPLSQRLIWGMLGEIDAGVFAGNVRFYEEVGSTNDVLRQMAAEHAPEGSVVIAESQTAGRGRLGRSWEAPPGSSLLMSVLFRPDLPPLEAYRLVMACGLAAAEACEAVVENFVLPGRRQSLLHIDVKWPNDLLIGGRKMTGILAEAEPTPDGAGMAWVVVGMGINVSQQFGPDHPLAGRATSLAEATGAEIDRLALLGAVLEHLHAWHGCPGSDVLAAWRDRCTMLGERVRIDAPGGVLEGVAEDLDPAGYLLLRDDAGALQRVAAGDASVLR